MQLHELLRCVCWPLLCWQKASSTHNIYEWGFHPDLTLPRELISPSCWQTSENKFTMFRHMLHEIVIACEFFIAYFAFIICSMYLPSFEIPYDFGGIGHIIIILDVFVYSTCSKYWKKYRFSLNGNRKFDAKLYSRSLLTIVFLVVITFHNLQESFRAGRTFEWFDSGVRC